VVAVIAGVTGFFAVLRGSAQGVSARRMDLGFLLVMALATSMTVPVVGALLMFSLMIGPAAAARSLTARPVLAMSLSVALALVTVWAGIVVSYQTNWPLGFFVGVLGAAFFLFGRAYAAARRHMAVRLRRYSPGRPRGARPGARPAAHRLAAGIWAAASGAGCERCLACPAKFRLDAWSRNFAASRATSLVVVLR
jgi:hypothetical protein